MINKELPTSVKPLKRGVSYRRHCMPENSNRTSTYEESCYFFYWDWDMNAKIPYCSKSGAIDPQDCNKKCPNYISHSQATMVINQHLAARQKVENHWKNVERSSDV